MTRPPCRTAPVQTLDQFLDEAPRAAGTQSVSPAPLYIVTEPLMLFTERRFWVPVLCYRSFTLANTFANIANIHLLMYLQIH